MFRVADLTDGRAASFEDHSHLAAGQTQGDVLVLGCQNLRRGSSRAGDLPALAGAHLDVMHNRAQGDVLERAAVCLGAGRSSRRCR